MTYPEALKALDTLYARLPTLACQRQCQESCGPILMSRVEWVRIQRQLGRTPKGKPHLTCPMLKQERCTVYAIRPMLCRLFGLVDDPHMRCPFGCQPERWLTSAEGHEWLQQVEAISHTLFPPPEKVVL